MIEYFRKRMTENVMSVRELFDFIVTDLQTLNKALSSPIKDISSNEISLELEDRILDSYIEKV